MGRAVSKLQKQIPRGAPSSVWLIAITVDKKYSGVQPKMGQPPSTSLSNGKGPISAYAKLRPKLKMRNNFPNAVDFQVKSIALPQGSDQGGGRESEAGNTAVVT